MLRRECRLSLTLFPTDGSKRPNKKFGCFLGFFCKQMEKNTVEDNQADDHFIFFLWKHMWRDVE